MPRIPPHRIPRCILEPFCRYAALISRAAMLWIPSLVDWRAFEVVPQGSAKLL
jgi:hypothetical protein